MDLEENDGYEFMGKEQKDMSGWTVKEQRYKGKHNRIVKRWLCGQLC